MPYTLGPAQRSNRSVSSRKYESSCSCAHTCLRRHRLQFILDYVCAPKPNTSGCASDLGCGNWRSWCVVRTPFDSVEWPDSRLFELHFVDAGTLNDQVDVNGTRGLDRWMEQFDALNKNLSRFNSFMHNKAMLFARDLAPFVSRLEEAGISTFRRQSLDQEGAAVGHVGFTVGSRILELVGPLQSLPGFGDSAPSSRFLEPEPWAPNECPQAQLLPASLAELAVLPSDPDDAGPLWNGTADALVFLGFSVAQGPTTDISTLLAHLTNFTGAEVVTQAMPRTGPGDAVAEEACDVTEITWSTMPNLAVRYVQNFASQPGAGDVQALDDYVASDHALYLNSSAGTNETVGRNDSHSSWYSWDAWLDQHVGLWYSGDETSCSVRAAAIREALQRDRVPVGERCEPDAHEVYSGFAGTMSWEFQFAHCDPNPEAPSECACIGSNNEEAWMNTTGGTCVQVSDDEGWCH